MKESNLLSSLPSPLSNDAPLEMQDPKHCIEINIGSIEQLFNSMDPSPFHEKDLDRDAEEFIVSWAQEFPRHSRLTIIIHLDRAPSRADAVAHVAEAVHHYFSYRAELNRRELKRLFRDGRTALLIGLTFLAVCLLAGGMIPGANRGWTIVREGLTIAGWVAMWRPMEIYLYDWWPLRRHAQILARLSQADVQLRVRPEHEELPIYSPGPR
jgi:hypothetical protein